MNFALAKEIYGLTPWCVDAISFHSLSAVLKNLQNGVALEVPEIKYNTPFLMQIKNETRIIQRDWQLDNNDKFEGIGIINLNGPITKGGGMSSMGMIENANAMRTMAKDQRIKGFIINTDSGGGASGAVQIMVDAINEVKQSKPVYALVTKGGMAGSAAYGIISAANKIYSEDKMNIVGSVGTMIQFEGKVANSKDKDGTKNIRLYATKSTAKNKAFEEAINNDNYELIISELLDPINDNFISQTLENRPQLAGSGFDTANTVFSKDAIGTFIDGIASFDQVVEMVMSESKIKSKNSKSNINPNSLKMTKQEIKQEHPTAYAEIVSEGVIQERERVSSWMKYSSADPEAVQLGIVNGTEITPSQREDFLIKMHSKTQIANLQADNATPVNTPESAAVIVAETAKNEELESAFKFEL